MLEILVQSWLLLTCSLLTVLMVVIGIQRGATAVRQLPTGQRRSGSVPVAPSTSQLYAVPARH